MRLILIGNGDQRKRIIESMSNQQLIDIKMRLTTDNKLSSRAQMERIVIHQICNLQNNYKYYKTQQSDKKQNDALTEFEKDELLINWINIAEQNVDNDHKLFNIILLSQDISKSKLLFTRYVHQIQIDIDSLHVSVLIKLYNAMNKIIQT